MTDKLPPNLMPALYSHRLHEVATIGRAHGYAMAIHGSMQRDLDVIAVPWVEKVTPEYEFVVALADRLGCSIQNEANAPATVKPHGRRAYTLLMGGACFMDLSVMPTVIERRRKR